MTEHPPESPAAAAPQSLDLPPILAYLRGFVAAREWEQFHSPKNLVMALGGEVGELTELFQWLTEAQSAAVMSDPKAAARVRDELADVVVYCLRLADVLGISLEQAIWSKFAQNAAKYPVETSRGHARKYDDLAGDES